MYEFYFVLLVGLIFSIFSIYGDLKYRRVSNYVSFSFLLVSLLYFFYNIFNVSDYDLLVLVLYLLIVYFLYYKRVIGAADGKVLMAIILLLISYGGHLLSSYFLFNLVVFYSIGTILSVLITSKAKEKKLALKNFDYHLVLYQTFIILVLGYYLFFVFTFFHLEELVLLVYFLKVLLIILFLSFTKSYFSKLYFNGRIIILLILAYLSYSVFEFTFILPFIILFILISIIVYSLSLVTIKHKRKERVDTAFMVYIYGAYFFTVLLGLSYSFVMGLF